jgi:hypothetical protein
MIVVSNLNLHYKNISWLKERKNLLSVFKSELVFRQKDQTYIFDNHDDG